MQYAMTTPIPEIEGQHVEDLVSWSVSLQSALMECNADKAALRAWHDAEQASELEKP